MQENPKKLRYEELAQSHLLGDLFRFFRESTGLAMAVVYLILLLCSMVYLQVVFDAFGLNVFRYLSFEDVFATPLKNPKIIVLVLTLLITVFFADVVSRASARQQLRYIDTPKTPWLRLYLMLLWVPRSHKNNVRFVCVLSVLALSLQVALIANGEVERVQNGEGKRVKIILADNNQTLQATLLGTSNNYVFTYQEQEQKTVVYYVESVKSIEPFKPDEDDKKAEEKQQSVGPDRPIQSKKQENISANSEN